MDAELVSYFVASSCHVVGLYSCVDFYIFTFLFAIDVFLLVFHLLNTYSQSSHVHNSLPTHLTDHRKRRYFVLRKDIRSICYYDNRENLTLLGSIPLDSETVITPVPSKDASK